MQTQRSQAPLRQSKLGVASRLLRAPFPSVTAGGVHPGRSDGPTPSAEEGHAPGSALILGQSHKSSLFLSNTTHRVVPDDCHKQDGHGSLTLNSFPR